MIAPETILRPYLGLLRWAILKVRARAGGEERISDGQLHDLMDAIENIPEMLVEYGRYFTPDVMNEYLVGYDQRWASDEEIGLIQILEVAVEQERERQASETSEPEIVFIVEHLHVHPGNVEDVKTIGVYGTATSAQAAVDRLRLQPGFRDYPLLVDPFAEGDPNGFYINEYRLDEDHWTEGYVTVS